MFVDLKQQYRKSLKSFDTEEHIDLAFYRPLGFAWAYLFRKIGVTPNAVTVASIFLGVGAGVCFYFDNIWISVLGIFLLVWANTFDSCDGQLARLTGSYSPLGRILDGLSGDLWFLAIYIAVCLHENHFSVFFGEHAWLIWAIAAAAGICHGKQAAMADYYRQFHLYFLKGEEGSELESAFNLKRQLAGLSWKKNFWKKLTLSTYTNYTVQQEATAPAMQALRRELRERFPDGRIPQDFRDAFRRASLPLMKYTNILSFNWRTIALFTSLFFMMPWLYFAFELTVLNILLIYMIVRHERICRRFTAELKAGKY